MEEALKTMDLTFLGNGKHKISLEKFFETENILFLDVRDIKEVQILNFNLSLLGIETIQIPINELPNKLSELPKNKQIACFCSSGTRSAWAYIYLFSKGYNVKYLDASNEDLAKMLKPGRIYKTCKQ